MDGIRGIIPRQTLNRDISIGARFEARSRESLRPLMSRVSVHTPLARWKRLKSISELAPRGTRRPQLNELNPREISLRKKLEPA